MSTRCHKENENVIARDAVPKQSPWFEAGSAISKDEIPRSMRPRNDSLEVL